MTYIIKHTLIWGPKVIPADVKASFEDTRYPWKGHFWSPWKFTEDGPDLELSTPLGVTWENLKSDLYGLLEWGAVGEVLVVDTDSENLIVKLVLGGTIITSIVVYTLTVDGAMTAATKEIYFPA